MTHSSTSCRSRAATRARRSMSSKVPRRSPNPRTSATRTDMSARGSRTSRRPPSSVSSPTTAPATATTTLSPPSSRASAAKLPTQDSTGSAFIKSLRGNDPDAALYWLAAMIAAGEDPKFIARRLIISASEDVGNADPRALTVAVSAAQALDWVGLPEAQYALAQAATYIATAPKSNRSGSAYWAAVTDVDEHGSLPVPLHLRGAPYARMKQHGIGVGYRYSHDFADADV